MKTPTLKDGIIVIGFLVASLAYGLSIRPLMGQEQLPIETLFLLSSFLSAAYLLISKKATWEMMQASIQKKVSSAVTAMLILMMIGVIIGAWIVSGTIPMFIYYGITLVNPSFIYAMAFLLPLVFSMLTGTSWGSAGTMGVVMISLGTAIGAELAIVAGAVVGGAYFGDKLSPLSDTTNFASIGAGVPLYTHVRSMINTTVPAGIAALIIYFVLGFVYPPTTTDVNDPSIRAILNTLSGAFRIHGVTALMLLLPVAVVIYGSVTKKSTVATLLSSSMLAALVAIVFQPFSVKDISDALIHGFNDSMIRGVQFPEAFSGMLNRGGLFSLSGGVMIVLLAFPYIGIIESINSIDLVLMRLLRKAKTRSSTILLSQAATAFANATTSNQSVTSFTIGPAFSAKYDEMKIPRKVLSRSIEDFGTMLENILPWTATGVFMAATLGVPVGEYWYWQFLSLFGFALAIFYAITGIGCFYGEVEDESNEKALTSTR